MSSVWAEQHRLHHPFIPKNRGGVDIPPRKLLSHRAAAAADMFMESPRGFEQFLPYNSESDDSDSDPYSSDHFRMYEFKVRRCTRTRSHDWTDCPFTHPGEKACRRDPRRFHYSGTVCSEYRRGSCSRGDNCEFAHSVFESWLHPSRYRTEACKDGKNCKRKVCFFAHSQRELRILPFQADDSPADPTDTHRSSASSAVHQLTGHCCMYCHHQPSAAISSPTSTLMGLSHLSSPPVSPSHSLSPPLSPAKYRSFLGGASSLSPASRYADQLANSVSYRNVLSEIIGSLDVMKVADVSSGDPRNKRSFPRVDTVFPGDDQTQFVLSPAAPSPAPISARDPFRNFKVDYDDNARDGLAAASDPDLGWVNELLT